MPKTDLVHGTLDMLVLRILAHEPMHGWGICERIQEISRDVLKVASSVAASHRPSSNGCWAGLHASSSGPSIRSSRSRIRDRSPRSLPT